MRGKQGGALGVGIRKPQVPEPARRPAAPQRSEGAKGLRSPRRDTPKVAPGAAEETGGFRGQRSKTNGKAKRSRKGLRSCEAMACGARRETSVEPKAERAGSRRCEQDKGRSEAKACRLAKPWSKTRRGLRNREGRPQGCRSRERKQARHAHRPLEARISETKIKIPLH